MILILIIYLSCYVYLRMETEKNVVFHSFLYDSNGQLIKNEDKILCEIIDEDGKCSGTQDNNSC